MGLWGLWGSDGDSGAAHAAADQAADESSDAAAAAAAAPVDRQPEAAPSRRCSSVSDSGAAPVDTNEPIIFTLQVPTHPTSIYNRGQLRVLTRSESTLCCEPATLSHKDFPLLSLRHELKHQL